jgi:hypothetical protein
MKGEEKYGDMKFIINGLTFSGMVILILITIFSFLSAVSGYRLDWFLWVQIGGSFLGIFLVVLSHLLEFLLEKYG